MKKGHYCPTCHRWTRRKTRPMSAVVAGTVRSIPDERCAKCAARSYYPEVTTA